MDDVITLAKGPGRGRPKPYPGAPRLKCGPCGHEWYPMKPFERRRSPIRCPECMAYLIKPAEDAHGENP